MLYSRDRCLELADIWSFLVLVTVFYYPEQTASRLNYLIVAQARRSYRKRTNGHAIVATKMEGNTALLREFWTCQTQFDRQVPFYTLPLELILDIIDLLAPDSFISFAFANYPLLLRMGLVPQLSSDRIAALIFDTNVVRRFQPLPIPVEIVMHIMSLLQPMDMMRFVLAKYAGLERQGIAPRLTPITLMHLLRAASKNPSYHNSQAVDREDN